MLPVSAINSAHPLALRPDRTSGRQSRRPPDALAARAGRRARDGGFPHQQADSGGGNAENRRSMERMTQRMGELLVMHRVGRNHIERTAQIVIQQPQNAVNHIVDMDPVPYCLPLPIGPPRPSLKAGVILPRIPPRGASTTPVRSRQTRVRSLCASQAICSPAGAQLMGKLIVRWLFFGHHHLAEVAIVADGRPADQHGGRGSLAWIRPTSRCVRSQRLWHKRCFCSAVQRLSAMGSPARLMTASISLRW